MSLKIPTRKGSNDIFGARSTLKTKGGKVDYYNLRRLQEQGFPQIAQLPYSIKIMLEAALRQMNGKEIQQEDVATFANWTPNHADVEVPYLPARVILQDFTGVPSVVDLAALRSAMGRMGGDPARINPVVPVDLVIDHSVQVDRFGSSFALMYNANLEFERNRERYEFLRWGKEAFDNFRVVPPATGIVHQVNLEYLAKVVMSKSDGGGMVAFPDTLVGTDSHTTMINGLGVVGWGVGGIEAEAVMLGQPMYMLLPEVIGFRITGALPEGATATDLVLTVTEMLRKYGVVGKFVEFFGAGLSKLSLADRATIANMAPEYGATIGFFPVDAETLVYLRNTGRDEALVDLVEQYSKEQGLFRTDDSPEAIYTDVLTLDLGSIEPSLAGPRRPQDRVPLHSAKESFLDALTKSFERPANAPAVDVDFSNFHTQIKDGSVVIAAITSCTNTSNPTVMVGAGLVAKKAVEAGIDVPAYVKTSLAPGSRVVTRYLDEAGLTPYLDALGFQTVGYGCTTCIGNSGPINDEISNAVKNNDLVVAAVLSGNRNFEGRVHPLTRANYLASPPLVVAYALAGRVDIDFATEPIGYTHDSVAVYLRDVWPSQEEVRETVAAALKPAMFESEYGNVFDGNEIWNAISIPGGQIYDWRMDSTYIKEPPFFFGLTSDDRPLMTDIRGARVLALMGDSITTDHISPAGTIPVDSPAGRYLIEHGVEPVDFNSYGSRRGNHEVMMRGTFANIRLKNKMVEGKNGGWTVYLPPTATTRAEGEELTIYDASMRYQIEGRPLIIIAGKEYGTGSSRDWAAKGTILLGVKAVLAESFERIHRSNLVGMGVLPLQFLPDQNAASLGLTGYEIYDIEGLTDDFQAMQLVTVRATAADGSKMIEFLMRARIDTPVEVGYYRNGGILHTVLRQMAKAGMGPQPVVA
jgi:aconitate hydratase